MLILKYVSLLLTLLVILFVSALVWATITNSVLVIDMENAAKYPRNFRTSSDVIKEVSINTIGLEDLKVAGSAQFSALALDKVLEKIAADNVLFVDLRQESHGFVNGNAISWFGPHNAANQNKTAAEIKRDENNRLSKISHLKELKVYQILEKTSDESISKTRAFILPTKQQPGMTEKELLTNRKLDYVRIYVQDFRAPSNESVDEFVTLMKQIPVGRWVYFHCRAGIGRTTTFMTMYDMMRNAKNVSFDDIMDRQRVLGGKDLMKLPNKDHYKYQWAEQRLNFLKKFYEYAKTNQDNYATSWSEWLLRGQERNSAITCFA